MKDIAIIFIILISIAKITSLAHPPGQLHCKTEKKPHLIENFPAVFSQVSVLSS